MISSCSSNDQVGSLDISENNFDSTLNISNRSSSSSCPGVIENGDFSDHNYTDVDDCYEGFANNLVTDWTYAIGSPDLWFQECDFGINMQNCTANPDHANMVYNTANEYAEGIMQENLNLSYTPDTHFSLCYSAYGSNGSLGGGSTAPDPHLYVYLTNGFVSNPAQFNNVPNLASSFTSKEVVIQPIANSGDPCFDPFGDYSIDFSLSLGQSFDQIVFYAYDPNPDIQSSHIRLDNISMECHSTLFTGIRADDLGGCEFDFRAMLSGNLNIVSYSWDFGDNNTSTSANPTHTYANPASYLVTLEIVDSNGCCTTQEVLVDCGPDPICTSEQCWIDFAGAFDCASAVELKLPNGTTILADFPWDVPVVGGHWLIGKFIEDAIASTGFPFTMEHNIPGCNKGGYVIPGWRIVSEVEVVKVWGNNNCGSGDASVEAAEFTTSCI